MFWCGNRSSRLKILAQTAKTIQPKDRFFRTRERCSRAVSLALALVAVTGCIRSIAHLEKHVDAGEYKEAVIQVTDDPAMQAELAAIILERAAAKGVQTTALIDALTRTGKPGKRALKRLAKHSEESVRYQAEVALHRGRLPEGADLTRFIEHDHSDVRARATQAWNSEMELGTLEKLLYDHDPRVRRWAADGLCRFNGTEGTDALLGEALRLDPDPKVRTRSAECGEALGPDSLLILKNALDDENLAVQLAALRGLVETGDPTARALVEERARSPLDVMAVASAAELARLGHAIGRDRIHDALKDARPGVREAALLRLERAKIQDRDTIFTDLLDDEAPRVVLLAASQLSIKKEVAEAVVKALKRLVDEGGSTSGEARDLLAVLGDAEALDQVIDLLGKGGEADIVATLTRTQRSTALAHTFVELMADTRESVRIAAARATLTTRKP
ncbi:MAG: HEAT repeat domain-containing protein [Proteobacteria bacterium]|nr:HEAT repeat domain-containing protein [Pseudomonadota bacterium]